MDSKWDIGSPTYLTVFLKYKSWLKTFSAYEQVKKLSKNKNYLEILIQDGCKMHGI